MHTALKEDSQKILNLELKLREVRSLKEKLTA